MFDIRDFGAKCDGDPASDDSAAWASAILAAQNAATNGSAIVYHPGGVSIIKHELTLGSNSIVQFIGGPNAVIKAGTGFPTDPTTPIAMLTISGTGFGSRFGAIRDIRFDGDGNAQVGLKVQAVQREFDNIAINNCTRIGLWVYGAQNCTFTSLTVESNGTSNALDANCWVDASAANNLFLRCQFSPTAGAGTQGEYNLVIRQSANITGLPPYPSLNRFIGCQFERVAMSYLGAILQRAGLNNAFIGCTINISGARYAVTIEKTEAGSPTSALLMLIDCVLSGQVNTGTAIKATTTDALAVGTQNLFLENFDYGFAVVNDAYVDLPAPFQVGSLPTGHLVNPLTTPSPKPASGLVTQRLLRLDGLPDNSGGPFQTVSTVPYLYDGVNQLLHFFTRDSGNPQWRSVDVVEQVIRTAAATSNGTVPIDSAGTRYQRITMGNFSFTVGNPSHAVVGRRLTIDIHNTASGTPTGTVTFSTDDPNGYKLTGGATTVSQPAASQHILITFDFDGSVWREVGRSADQT